MLDTILENAGIANKRQGSQIVIDCPFCGKVGHCYVNPQNLTYDCKVCDAKGNGLSLFPKLGIALTEVENFEGYKKRQTLTVAEYAAAKKLDLSKIKNAVNTTRGIKFDLFDDAGKLLGSQYRISLTGDRFRFEKGTKANRCIFNAELLPKYDTAKPIYIVEGKSDADTANQYGLQILGTCGKQSGQKTIAAYLQKYGFAKAYVIVEPQAEDFYNGIKKHLTTCQLYAIKLPEKDLSELHIKRPNDFLQTLQDCTKTAVDTIEAEPQFEPLIDLEDTQSPEFDLLWLPRDLASFVHSAAKSLQCEPESLAMMALGVCSYCVSKHNVANTKPGYYEDLNLYVCSLEQSGSRKSAKHRLILSPLAEMEQELRAEQKTLVELNKANKRQIEKRITKLEDKLSKGDDAVKDELDNLVSELAEFEDLYLPTLYVNDSTPEAAAKLLSQNGERLLVADSEATLFHILDGRYSKTANMDLYLKSSSGDAVKISRMNREPLILKNPCLSVCLTCQPAVLSSIKNVSLFDECGLLGRFLFVIPDETIFDEFDSPAIPEYDLQNYNNLIRNLLSIKGKKLRFEPKAKDIFEDYFRDYAQRMYDELAPIIFWTAKARGNAIRIASIFELISNPDANTISVESITSAIELMNYLTIQALNTFCYMRQPDDLLTAKRILRWVKKNHLSEFAAGDLRCLRTSKTPDFESLQPAIDRLIKNGYLITKIEETGRRPSLKYIVNPQIRKDK